MKFSADPASSFHFPETVQVFSNHTPINQSSINFQQKKNSATTGLVIYKYSTPKLRNLSRDISEGKL